MNMCEPSSAVAVRFVTEVVIGGDECSGFALPHYYRSWRNLPGLHRHGEPGVSGGSAPGAVGDAGCAVPVCRRLPPAWGRGPLCP